ncbi:MAG: FixH family protein, partial [Terriglobales bacterium]
MAKNAIFLCLIFASLPAFAQRAQGELACTLTKTDFIYDCTIKLTRHGQPLPGAEITVGADMPSMPMAHNVKPVKAKPGKAPGEYEAKLDLEMLGEWAVKLRLGGPLKDQLILLYEFDEKGARPVIRSGTA